MATKKPWVSAGDAAAQHFGANGNALIGVSLDVRLFYNGAPWEVTAPWLGAEIGEVDVVWSNWYKSFLGRLRRAAHTPVIFTLVFPVGTTEEEAKRCAETYMLLLNMARIQHS